MPIYELRILKHTEEGQDLYKIAYRTTQEDEWTILFKCRNSKTAYKEFEFTKQRIKSPFHFLSADYMTARIEVDDDAPVVDLLRY